MTNDELIAAVDQRFGPRPDYMRTPDDELALELASRLRAALAEVEDLRMELLEERELLEP